MLVDGELTVIRANEAARRSFNSPAPPVALARVLRDPGVLAAVGAALAGNAAGSVAFSADPRPRQTVQLEDRARRSWRRPARRADDDARADRAGDDRADALGFRRQREPRDPDAAGVDPGDDRDLARSGASSIRRRARCSSRSWARRRPGWRGWWTTCSPCRASSLRPSSRRASSATRSEALNFAVDRMRATAEQGGVTLAVDVPREASGRAGDDDQLHQLFVNLIDNAIKYGGQGTAVHVEAVPLAAAPAEFRPGYRQAQRVYLDQRSGARKSRPSTCRGSPSAFTASKVHAAADPRARASGWRSSSTYCGAIRGTWRSEARPVPAARSRCCFRPLRSNGPLSRTPSRNSHKSSVDPGDL